jgi:F0F1-type ATP synthase assembly protein I
MSRRYWQRPLRVPAASADPLSHGLAMIAAPVVFGLIGALIDSGIGTGPAFLIALAAFGVACSFASAYYRYSWRIDQESAGKPWTRSRGASA